MTEYKHTSVVETKTTLLVEKVEPNLNVFKRTVEAKRKKGVGDFVVKHNTALAKAQGTQGFVDDANLDKMLKGLSYRTRDLVVVTDKYRDATREWGWNWYQFLNVKKTDGPEYIRNDVYDAIVTDKFPLDLLLEFKTDCHMLFDRNGDPLPVGKFFDYIDAAMHNGAYDLAKAAEHLLKRDDIKIFGKKDSWRDDVDYTRLATTVEEAIHRIPYYNADRDSSSYIPFLWMPKPEDYKRMWAQAVSYGTRYPSTQMTRAVFDLDLFGLRACGAAKFDDFYKRERSDRDDYEDEDEDY